ncbi:fructuronate reductase/mannitol 2-dehydrogenase [Sphingopyxis panaciterrae]|uniref:mannitol dehydrogenase family protein n=1 Tax=Sphingopyxis panaciterrae TaxID=363841 RepID=UPI00141E7374|nr:mannitol dehydrogenase family protein [Sphingopyxis panaciterrae]NIJ36062.1 fructuronate reductase/mannitol 2-dehydrogenase [Sphingopyxis panaciterrae]
MPTPVRPSRKNLGHIPPTVARPHFDRTALRRGIVHLGMGGFHRAHMARYTHDLMEKRADALAWGIAGVGLMPADAPLGEALAAQDHLYTLVERDAEADGATIIGSVVQAIFAPSQRAAMRAAIDDPATRIVSLTVTEAGYCLDSGSKRLNFDHPLIRHDLAEPAAPRSAIGIILDGLRRRRDAGQAPFTVLSCDNIQHNGDVLRRALLDLAKAQDAALARWVEDRASVPNTMVDRITPVTRPDDLAWLETRFGLSDACPVFSERFRQWVIEDRFPSGRPAWEEVGVEFAADVTPFEQMKLRLLNASHLAIAAPGELASHALIDEAMRDERLSAYMTALMDRETGPTVRPPPGIDLAAYQNDLVHRFANPNLRDTTARVNADAPLNYLLDPLRDRIGEGLASPLLEFALAAWIRRLRGRDDRGQPIAIRHPMADVLRPLAESDPAAVLSIRPLFGDLAGHPGLQDGVSRWLAAMDAHGTLGALAARI